MSAPPTEIVVVDDNAQDAELTASALRSHAPEAKVHRARDGAEAIAIIGQLQASSISPLVLLDLKMPRVSGFEMLRRLRREPSGQAVRVVVLTSSSLASDVKRAYSLGANSYVVKPVQYEAFVQTIGHICNYWLQVDSAPPPDSA